MSYSPLRAVQYVRDVDKEEKERKSNLLDYTTAAAVNDPTYRGLAHIIQLQHKKRGNDQQAQSMMMRVMMHFAKSEDHEEDENLLAKGLFYVAKRALIQIGKRIVVSVLRPLVTMAFNIVRSIVGFAIRGIIRFVIAPIITGIAGILMANPLIALAGLALGGAIWWAWNKFFKKPTPDTPDGVVIPEKAYTPAQTYTPMGSTRPTGLVAVPQVYSPIEVATSELKKTPVPKGAKFEGFGVDIDAYIKETAIMYKLPEDILRGFVKMEAGWTGAMSPTGAIGTGQFIMSTWNSLAATPAGQAIGMTPITTGPKGNFRKENDPRFNMRINTLATGLLARMNADILIKNNLPVTGENLYMLHNIGPGIIKVMKGLPVSDATLLAMQQNGMKVGMTPEQFLAYQKGRFNQQYAIANQKPTTVDAPKPDATKPLVMEKKPEPALVATPAANNSTAKTSVSPTAPASENKTLVTKGKTVIAINN